MTRHVGVWAFLVALTATSATVTPGWSEEPAREAPREAQAPTAEELAAAREARFRTVWSAADAPHQAGDYAESERRYKQVLVEFPDSQRAALRVAIAQERQGKSAEALESYDRALAADPQGEWAPVALFYKARFCKEGAREPDARAAIARLRAEHPDSSYVARAAVLEAELDGRSTAAAEAALERELAAAAVYDAGMAKSKARADEEALADLRRVPAEFPGTAAALRALDAEGHILTRNRRFDEALVVFEAILQALEPGQRSSRIAQTSQRRVAGLLHAKGRREESLLAFSRIISDSTSPEEAGADAILQAAGLTFELMLEDFGRNQPVSAHQVEELESLFAAVRSWPSAPISVRIRADLMHIESLAWQNRFEEFEKLAIKFLDAYEAGEFPREVATARFFLGRELIQRRKICEGLPHLLGVIELFPRGELWPGSGMTHIEEAYHDAIEAQFILARQAEARELYEQFKDGFGMTPFLGNIDRKLAIGYYENLRATLDTNCLRNN
jgi:tetratricopeptide (TPR) repeat protein